MWLAVRFLARTPALPPLRLAGVRALAVLAAFSVANLSFWAFSGYFGDMSAMDYAASVLKYLPPYRGSTALYLALGWVALHLVRTRVAAYRAYTLPPRAGSPCPARG